MYSHWVATNQAESTFESHQDIQHLTDMFCMTSLFPMHNLLQESDNKAQVEHSLHRIEICIYHNEGESQAQSE